MASGVPVIVSSRAGVSELIKDMEDGIILKNPADVNELREKILLLANNPRLRKTLGNTASHTAQNYTWLRMAQATEKLLIPQ